MQAPDCVKPERHHPTCRTVAEAVLTTLSELRALPSSRKQMPSTDPMLSCAVDQRAALASAFSIIPHSRQHQSISQSGQAGFRSHVAPYLQVCMHWRLQQRERRLQRLQLHTLIMQLFNLRPTECKGSCSTAAAMPPQCSQERSCALTPALSR